MASDPQREMDLADEAAKLGDLVAAEGHYRAAAQATSDPAVGAEALRRVAVMCCAQSSWDRALEAAADSASMAEAAGLRDPFGAALNAAGIVHHARGHLETARKTFDQVLGLAPSDRVRGVALANLGNIAAQTGAWDVSRRRFEQARKCFQRAGYVAGEAHALNNYGRAALDHGNHRLAAELLREAMAFAGRHATEADLRALASMNYAEAISHLGEGEEATRIATEALETFISMGNTWRRIETLRILGDLAERAGDAATAAVRWREGLALAEEIGTVLEAQLLRDRLERLNG